MRKYFYSVFAAATMMLIVTSCSQEEDIASQSSREMVTFEIQMEGATGSRAAGDGELINSLYYEVFQAGVKVLDNNPTATEAEKNNGYIKEGQNSVKQVGNKFTVELPLMKGEHYEIAFWAQNAENSIYDVQELTAIKVNYKNGETNLAVANTEAYDAFFYGGTIKAEENKTITLYRPFAQLNIGTTKDDWNNAKLVLGTDVDPVTSSTVTVTGLANTFNALNGNAEGEETVVFTKGQITKEDLPVNGKEYYNLAMNYLLVPGQEVKNAEGEILTYAKSNTNVTATFFRGEKELFTIGDNLQNVTIQRNYRTNLLGNLLSENKVIEVIVDKEFDGDHNEGTAKVTVKNEEEFLAALQDQSVREIVLSESFTFGNIQLADARNAKSELDHIIVKNSKTIIGAEGITLTYSGNDRIIDVPADAKNVDLTIKDLTINSSSDYCQRGINYNSNGTLTLENVKVSGKNLTYAVNLPGSSDYATVNIKNCELQGNIALNVWGENSMINVENSTLTSVDNSSVEGYSAIVLNNDGETSAENTVVKVENGSITAKDENDEPSKAVLNGTITGKIEICENTEVIGTIDEVVAIVDYGTSEFYACTSLQDAIDKVIEGKAGSVRLIKDFAITESVKVTGDMEVIIDLNGKTITGTDNTDKNYGLINNTGKLTIENKNAEKAGKLVLSATKNREWNSYSSVISNNPGGNLTVGEGVIIEHLGGTDMAYGIDNLTNGKGTSATVTINGATVKSVYRAVRQFLNGVEATNELTVNSGVIEGTNKSIWMQDPNKNANTGKLVVSAEAQLKGDVYLFVTAGSTEWPVEVSIAADALAEGSTVISGNVPEGYEVILEEGVYKVVKMEKISDGLYTYNGKYFVYTADGLEALNAKMADKTAGKQVKVMLAADIDFNGKTWTPVDSHADTKFTFSELDGQGHTISNLTVNGQAMFSRFAGTGDVIVKNVTFDNAQVNSNGKINTSILTIQSYQNVLLDNVDVKNSNISGGYKVAPLIATLYNESSSTVTATLKNCDVENVCVTATTYDFCTTGMVAFVYADDNDKIEFENCTVKDVKLIAPVDAYKAHAAIYTTGSGSLYNEAEGVTVTNVTFEELGQMNQ